MNDPNARGAAMGPRAAPTGRWQDVGCLGADRDLRCGCGSLLARLVAGAVELKCRRCKTTWRIALHTG